MGHISKDIKINNQMFFKLKVLQNKNDTEPPPKIDILWVADVKLFKIMNFALLLKFTLKT